MKSRDHELEALLSLDGCEFRFDNGCRIKIDASAAPVSGGRPKGVKYSLTLHDPDGTRIYGLDNAHSLKGSGLYDHRHVDGGKKTVPYVYKGAGVLLEDFYREVDRIMAMRGGL